MLRAAVTVTVVLSAFACGTPCTRVAAAESAANDKGVDCGSSPNTSWDSAHIQRCEAGLSKCSADDMKWLDTYADCLQKLPVCVDGQGLSWGLSRITCAESAVKVSATCASAIR